MRIAGAAVVSDAMAVPFAAFVYFAVVFAFAFALGVVRTLLIAPWTGALAAVLMEVPVVVVVSWIAARRVLRERDFTSGQRAAMGAIAFALLMASEALLAGVLRGQSVGEWAGEVGTPPGLIGLAGQIGFALIPLLVRKG
jgi:xanthine/uracil/vitamin C permease (AzgA family)